MNSLLLLSVLPAYILLSTLITWVCYLAVEKLEKNKANYSAVQKAGAYLFVGLGVCIDAAYNVTTGNLLFAFKHWNTLLFTSRLNAALAGTSAWRKRIAGWMCAHMLDRYTYDGRKHCRWPQP